MNLLSYIYHRRPRNTTVADEIFVATVQKSATEQHTTVTLFSLVNSIERVCNKIKRIYYKVLLDTGSSATLITPKIGLLCKKSINCQSKYAVDYNCRNIFDKK